MDAKTRMMNRLFRRHTTSDKPLTQVERIIMIFGGAEALREALREAGYPRSKFTIYRWNYPRSHGGSNGMIPNTAWPGIIAAARNKGILLSSEEIDPRPIFGEDAQAAISNHISIEKEDGNHD